MGKIRLLSDTVASQVAAGEVVERPASIIKELVENSLDAGATRIEVEFARGGVPLLRVSDNGCGMDREDALLCLERHATSKIRTAADLSTVATMGFRGEALPSIASVSRFRLLTREQGAPEGVEIEVAGGKVENVRSSGEAPGTRIEVRTLFYNVPARRKFLRSEETESAHIIHQMEALALANPGTAFSCLRDGRKIFQTATTSSLGVRLQDLFGKSFTDRLVEIPALEIEGVKIHGFLARPGEGKVSREQQYVILNGRVVHCPEVSQPLREAYAGVVARGHHPLAALVITLDPETVDCNVHPAKREVRLHRPDAVRRAVYEAASLALKLSHPAPSITSAAASLPSASQAAAPIASPAAFANKSMQAEFAAPTTDPDNSGESDEPELFRFLGRLGKKFLIMESAEGLVLVNARTARERILFESLIRQMAAETAPCQKFLLPAVLELTPKDHAWVTENLELLRLAGFLLDPFGVRTVRLEGLPACLPDADPAALLEKVCEMIRAAGKVSSGRLGTEPLARSVARIAAGDTAPDNKEEAGNLMRSLLRCELPYACPFGRPTMIQFSMAELERKFGNFG